MCPFNSRRFLVAFFIAISVFGAYGQSHFTFTANTGDNMTVLVQAAINPAIDGSAIANGDEIGVFTPAGLCVGAVAWNGVNTALAVWGDNDQTVPIDGCVAGELLSYKVWDASAAKEAPVTVAYASGVPDYSVDGMAVLASLSATTPPSTPILNSPTDAAANQLTSLTLSWNTATGAATYHVQVSTSNIFASILLEDSTLVTTSRAVTGLSNSAVYYWRVRAKNAGGVSAWASAWSFTTIIAAPAVPLLALPTDATTGQTLSPTLSWNTATGAATYHVQVSTSNTFASILLEDSTLTATSKTITGLDNNLTHYWRVRAKNAGNVSAWASPWSFATAKIGLFPVSAGWNMISLNIHPQDSSAGALLGPLHGIVLSKNNLGQIYWPAYGINTIGNLATGQGYTLYTDSVDTIRTLGPGIDAVSTPLALAAGWNMIGYLPENDMPVATALSAIVAQTTIVKNSRGDIYWPDYSISTIGNMKVGQGYKIHMKSSATLTYPALGKSLVGAHELLAPPEAVHYLLKLNTGNTASVLSNMVIVNGTIAPDNSEIGAFDEKGVLVGAGVVIHGITVFSVWGDNAQTPKKDGCIAAEKIMFRLWDGAQEYPATFEGPTAVSYQEDGLFIGRLTVPEALSITKFALEDAYPNPFGGQVQILFDVPALGGLDRQNIDVAVYDVRGRLVHQVAKGRYKASRYRTYWKGQDDKGAALGCGIYIIRMKARNFSKNLKLVRLK